MGEVSNWRKEWPDWKMTMAASNVTYKSKILNAAVIVYLDSYFINTKKLLSLANIKKDYEKMVKETPSLEAMDADGLISYIYLYERGLVGDVLPEDAIW